MIKLEGISKHYGSVKAIESIDLEFSNGVYGLLGPNGAGKTTLLRCLIGILKPSTGKATRPKNLGYLPQKFGMFKELSVFEAMKYFAELKQIPPRTQKDGIIDCLTCVRLEKNIKHKIGSLSGGMIRRLGIAQALLGEPQLVVFDEPTAGLDPEERLNFKNLIGRRKSVSTIIVSTHIVEDVEFVCDHVLILHQGKLLANSSVEEIRSHAEGFVYIVSATEQSQLRSPYLLVREEVTESVGTLRVLSSLEQPGTSARPTVEDGYLLYMHPELC